MSRSPAKSGNATVTKSLKEKWLSIVQLAREKGEKGIGGSSTVTSPNQSLLTHRLPVLHWHCSQPTSPTGLPHKPISPLPIKPPFPSGMLQKGHYSSSEGQASNWQKRNSDSGLWMHYSTWRTGGGCGNRWHQHQSHWHPRLHPSHTYHGAMLPMSVYRPRSPPMPRIYLPLLSTGCPWTPPTHLSHVLLPHLWRAQSCGHQLPNRNRSSHTHPLNG